MNDQCDDLLEKAAVVEVTNRLFIGTDRRDWTDVAACFADDVLFDMTSIAGGKPERMTPQQIVDGWDAGLRGLKAVHHQVGNHVISVDRDEAEVFCYGIAFHYLPNITNRNTRTFVGTYDLHLRKKGGSWRIDRFRFNLKFIDGNLDLGGTG